MKRLLLSVWLLSLSLLSAVAENYPYKSDVLWVTVPNHADWLYKTGEKAPYPIMPTGFIKPEKKQLWRYNSINTVSPGIT